MNDTGLGDRYADFEDRHYTSTLGGERSSKGLPVTHIGRQQILRNRWTRLGVLYEQFLDLSKQARYDMWVPGVQDLAKPDSC